MSNALRVSIIFLIVLLVVSHNLEADNFSTSVHVYVCGNGLREDEELCDDGENNGRYAYNAYDKFCNTFCNGWAPYCGDSIIQSTFGETCDDGNNNSGDGCNSLCQTEVPPTTTTTLGGGGGGGGGAPTLPETKVVFNGRAYPKSTVTLLKDAQVVATTVADETAKFQLQLTGLTAGNYIFSLYSEDSQGNRSSLLTFPLSVTPNVTLNVNNIFIAPTIDVDKLQVKKGDNLAIFGQSAPQAEIVISISSNEEQFVKTNSDKSGAYLYNLDTAFLDYGSHYTKSKASLENQLISSYSQAVNFQVGNQNILKPRKTKCSRADLNCDGRVNLIDFSIAAYWYRRALSAEFRAIETERLNGDGKITLVDFSILAYYWTG